MSDPIEIFIEMNADADKHGRCEVCCGSMAYRHDHRADFTGLDDGPWINPPRKRAEPKDPEIMADIRRRAWETRRRKYGECGHR